MHATTESPASTGERHQTYSILVAEVDGPRAQLRVASADERGTLSMKKSRALRAHFYTFTGL